ncbi:hypothetical protein Q5752_001595 [Cryptotrichosporon argae]
MSEQSAVSPCCTTGHIHEGDPLGAFEVLYGLRTYVSNPSAPASGAQNVVVLLPEVFGVDLVNTKLVADEWAANGWKALVPDVFEGDAVPIEYLKAICPNMRDKAQATVASKAIDTAKSAASLGPWLIRHREAVARPIVQDFFTALRADPSTGKVAAVGYCWGGRYALLQAQDDAPGRADVAVAFHPSFLVETDVEPIKTVPVAILKGDQDDILSEPALDGIERVLDTNLGTRALVKRYKDAVHGFAIRGDDMIESEKRQKEDAHDVAMKFVNEHFGA